MMLSMEASSSTSAALETVLLLSQARTKLVRDVDRAVNGHGLGFGDYVLLRELRAAPDGRMRRTELAERLGVTTSNVARQLGPLGRIGVVDRESNPRDARLALVVLTEAGARLVDEATVSAEARAGDVVARHWNDEERSQLATLLAGVTR
ncbi:MAG: MarR family transcriptional regulator [Thermoleophilia bacterium]|nr:MarR family transcriptional regulator [Thermoleophilia bacterium]